MSKTTPVLTLRLHRAATPPAPKHTKRSFPALAALSLSDLTDERGLPRFGPQTGLLDALFKYIEAGGAGLNHPSHTTPSTEIRA
jgi:hypothetical protein